MVRNYWPFSDDIFDDIPDHICGYKLVTTFWSMHISDGAFLMSINGQKADKKICFWPNYVGESGQNLNYFL